jgi:hypothetical protein
MGFFHLMMYRNEFQQLPFNKKFWDDFIDQPGYKHCAFRQTVTGSQLVTGIKT